MSNKLRKLSKEITLTPRRHHRKKAFILKELRANIMEQKMAGGMSKENAELSALIATSPYKIDSKGVRQPLVDFSQLSSESQQVLLGVMTAELNNVNNEVSTVENNG